MHICMYAHQSRNSSRSSRSSDSAVARSAESAGGIMRGPWSGNSASMVA